MAVLVLLVLVLLLVTVVLLLLCLRLLVPGWRWDLRRMWGWRWRNLGGAFPAVSSRGRAALADPERSVAASTSSRSQACAGLLARMWLSDLDPRPLRRQTSS